MATFRGRGILYGIQSQSISGSTGTVSCSFQSSDYGQSVEQEIVMDCTGSAATHITKTSKETLSVSYVFTSGTNSGTATVVHPAAGSVVGITDASHAAAAGNWIVASVGVKRTNTTAAIVDLSLERSEGITY